MKWSLSVLQNKKKTVFHYESIVIYNKRLRTEIKEESQKSNKTLLSWPYRFSILEPGKRKAFTVSTFTKDDIMLNVIAHLNKCLRAGEVIICILYFLMCEAFSYMAMYNFIHLYPHVPFMNVTLKHINLDDWPVINNTSFLAVTYRCNWIDSVLLWLFDLYSKGKSWYQTSENLECTIQWWFMLKHKFFSQNFFRKQLIANR